MGRANHPPRKRNVVREELSSKLLTADLDLGKITTAVRAAAPLIHDPTRSYQLDKDRVSGGGAPNSGTQPLPEPELRVCWRDCQFHLQGALYAARKVCDPCARGIPLPLDLRPGVLVSEAELLRALADLRRIVGLFARLVELIGAHHLPHIGETTEQIAAARADWLDNLHTAPAPPRLCARCRERYAEVGRLACSSCKSGRNRGANTTSKDKVHAKAG